MSKEVTIADLEGQLLSVGKEIKAHMETVTGQIKENGKASTEAKAAVETLSTKANEIGNRLDKLEAWKNTNGVNSDGVKSLGERLVESDSFKSMQERGRGTASFSAKGAEYRAIVNATGQNQPLVPAQRDPRILIEPQRRLRIRDLIPSGRTSSNLIEVPYENSFTDNAGPQAGNSPTEYENVSKNESDATFRLDSTPVTTLAHFIHASKQVLADAAQLSSYIDTRLRYFLKLEEEAELINGSGNSGNLRGLWTYRTAYAPTTTSQSDTKIDTLRRAKLQMQQNEYDPSVIILNPTDSAEIEMIKDADGRYIWADPTAVNGRPMWGVPVVVTNSMTAGRFLLVDTAQASMIWDREDMSVSVSTEEGNNFTKNMVTILAEERLAHVIYLTRAIVGGTFNTSPQ